MNSGNTPSEIASYIVRRTEDVNCKQSKKIKKNGKKIWCVGIPACLAVLALVFVCVCYGTTDRALAAEETKAAVATESIAEEARTEVADEQVKEAERQEPEKVIVAESATEVEKAQEDVTEEQTMTGNTVNILNGDELFGLVATQRIENQYEENISGLLWNYELIADIKKRAEEAEDASCEESYRELLVTMGMDEDYQSQDPELPSYLTKKYNPQMDVELSEAELSELLRLVEAEAPSEDIYGKILVANVVLNRVNNEKMANTVTGVIYEKIGGSAQFSPTAISWYWNSIVVTDSTREAVARCLSGEDYSDGALYFHAWEKNPNKHKTSAWMQDLECLFTHGGHRFFR